MTHNDQLHRSELMEDETKLIADAAKYLESPTLLMSIANVVGKPVELLFKGFEKIAPQLVEEAAGAALRGALTIAVFTIPNKHNTADDCDADNNITEVGTSTDWWHKLSVALTGMAGGLFGPPGLLIELPVTTAIMLRSIAATASDFGEDLAEPEVCLQCLSVFGYGNPQDAMECSYLTTRLGLQQVIREATKFLGKVTAKELPTIIERGAAPALVNMIGRIAAEFNIAVTEKLVAQSLPVVGALFGAAVNVAFIDHFNRVARFHFGMRSLGRKYGQERIDAIYRATALALRKEPKPPVVPTIPMARTAS